VRAFPAKACCEKPQGREKDSTAKWDDSTDSVVRSRYRTLDGRRIPREEVPAAVTKPVQAVERVTSGERMAAPTWKAKEKSACPARFRRLKLKGQEQISG
jgi:hypothetical protein